MMPSTPISNDWNTQDMSPLVIPAHTALAWDDEADVVIVGFGGAGACAALEAAAGGAEVLALDRFEGGGATAYSGGIIYAGGPSFQKEIGRASCRERVCQYV